MNANDRKNALIERLQKLGFTFEEAHNLRRIELTLSRWGEAECNGEIERDEKTGKPVRNSAGWVSGMSKQRHFWKIADREAGALKRLNAIIAARNLRVCPPVHVPASPVVIQTANAGEWVHAYHQSDPRGCSLYLLKAADLPDATDEAIRKHSGEWAVKDDASRLAWKLSCYYNRGLAVCV